MNIPDYISPIVGYRVWQWDAAGLKSLNGEPWRPGQPLVAGCRVSSRGTIVGRAEAAQDAHGAPQADCSCGVYAAKDFEHLRRTGYERYGIHGEVNLWGTVVEHKLGYRAQYGYPKNLFLPPDMIPFTMKEVKSRLDTLIAYGMDIFVVHDGGSIPLWRKGSGLAAVGVDCLIGKRRNWYARHKRDRTLKKGDRVAILGRGIAVVEQVDGEEVHAVLWNRSMLRIGRKEIVWDERNMRWETNPSSLRSADARRLTGHRRPRINP